MYFSLSLIINNSTKCFLFNACGDTLASLIRITSLVFSSSLSSSFILWNPPYSKIVIVEISRLSFSTCAISLIVGGKLILSIFNCSRHFNNFLDILSKFLLPSSSLKTDIPTAYKKHLPLFFEFIVALLLANFFDVDTKLLAEVGFITWNLTYIF